MGEQVQRGSAYDHRVWWFALISCFALMMLVNPSGFIGGGKDDWQYLQAARCLREHGLCLPHNHWQARWPVNAPIAFFTAIWGESRFSVSVAPAIASFVAILLLAPIGNRLFRPPIGWIAAFFLLLTPAFSTQLSEPAVEATELCFIFAGFLSVLTWQERPSPRWAFAAGFLFSLAIQVRETAAVAALFAFVYLSLSTPKPKVADVLFASAGLALPFLVEFAWFAISVGDPFYRLKLSMNHTQIWSSELLGPIDRSHPPFFNKAYIANWQMDPGLHVHWTIDGLINIFVNGVAGLSLPFVTLALLFGRQKIGSQVWRQAFTLLLVAIGYMACLIYALAIDPKPRMMLPALSIANLALALIVMRLGEIGNRLVAYAICLAAGIVAIVLQYGRQRTELIEGAANRWIATYPAQIEIEPSTRKYLALVPAARALPAMQANRPLLLYASGMPCARWIAESGLAPSAITTVAAAKNTLVELPMVGGDLCLFRYEHPIADDKMETIMQRVRLRDRVTSGLYVSVSELPGNASR